MILNCDVHQSLTFLFACSCFPQQILQAAENPITIGHMVEKS